MIFRHRFQHGKQHGLQQSWYRNGRKRHEYYCDLGRVHGEYKEWDVQGRPTIHYSHNMGFKHGDCKNWKNGVLVQHTSYVNDVRDGFVYLWDDNGTLLEQFEYKGGVPHGVCKIWRDGNLVQYSECQNGRANGLTRIIHDDVEDHMTCVNGVRHGSLTRYSCEDGKLILQTMYKDNIKDGDERRYVNDNLYAHVKFEWGIMSSEIVCESKTVSIVEVDRSVTTVEKTYYWDGNPFCNEFRTASGQLRRLTSAVPALKDGKKIRVVHGLSINIGVESYHIMGRPITKDVYLARLALSAVDINQATELPHELCRLISPYAEAIATATDPI